MENLNEQPVLQEEVDDQREGEEGYAAVGNHADQPWKKIAGLGKRNAIINNGVITCRAAEDIMTLQYRTELRPSAVAWTR